MSREITEAERDLVAKMFPKATPKDAQFDKAWNAIMTSDELRRARARLSIHELRLIIEAAISAGVP